MMLGSGNDRFSAGELTFISRAGLQDEYCSCLSKIAECDLWQEILSKWALSRPISLEKYGRLKRRYEGTKTIFRILANVVRPSTEFLEYVAATESLFAVIHAVTGAEMIIDSSKAPARILVLRRFSDLTVVHLCRNFSGVMNSGIKFFPKNIEEGVELDKQSTSPSRALLQWVLTNLLTTVFSFGIKRHKVHYRQIVSDTSSVFQLFGDEVKWPANRLFSAGHMLAGNRMRLRKDVKIDPMMGFSYKDLTPGQRVLGSVVDRLFWFWARR